MKLNTCPYRICKGWDDKLVHFINENNHYRHLSHMAQEKKQTPGEDSIIPDSLSWLREAEHHQPEMLRNRNKRNLMRLLTEMTNVGEISAILGDTIPQQAVVALAKIAEEADTVLKMLD